MRPYQNVILVIVFVAIAFSAGGLWFASRVPSIPLDWSFGGVVFALDRIEPRPEIRSDVAEDRQLQGFWVRPEEKYTFEIVLPPGTVLDLSLRTETGKGGRFELTLQRPGDTTEGSVVFFRDLGEIAGAWRRERVDLSAAEGRCVLGFRLEGAGPGAEVFVGDARLCVPEARLRRRVVLICCDGFGPDSDGMKELATSGFWLEEAWPGAADPTGSWASVLTGLYPPQHRAGFDRGGDLPEGFLTLPELLLAKGWASVAFVSGEEAPGPDAGIFQGFGEVARHQASPEAAEDALDWLERFGDSPSMLALFLEKGSGETEPWTAANEVLNRVLEGELSQTLVLVMGNRGQKGDMPPLWIAGAGLAPGRSEVAVHQVGVFLTVCHAMELNPPRDLEGSTLLAPIGGYDITKMRLLCEVRPGEYLGDEEDREAWLEEQRKRFRALFE
ncbi:MAG: hypothetical protein RL885_27745 [Planctomycetota bacterium]